MRAILFVLSVLTFSASAQQSPYALQACAGKVQDEATESVNLRAQVLGLMAENKALTDQLAEAKKTCGEKCEPPKKP